MKRMLMAGLAVVLVGLAAPALAQGKGSKMPDFATMDADGNGLVSVDELRAAKGGKRPERFIARLDANGDGALSAEEFAAAKDRKGRRGGDHKGGRDHKRGKGQERRASGQMTDRDCWMQGGARGGARMMAPPQGSVLPPPPAVSLQPYPAPVN